MGGGIKGQERQEGLGPFSTDLRSLNVGFISLNCLIFGQPVSASHHLPRERDEHLQDEKPRPLQGATLGGHHSLHQRGERNLKVGGTNPTLSSSSFP